jgi:hypothetical protein
MPRLSIWNSGKKGANYTFIDRHISQYVFASGTAAYVHLYVGVHEQGPDAPASNVKDIQDVILMENRDRKYSSEVYELRAMYNVNDLDFDMKGFGIFLTNDTIFIEFHLNDSIAQLGRKLMSGDVIELPHLRDDAGLDQSLPAANKFYVITDVNRASDGYSPTWYPHLLRAKCEPMVASQETADILEKQSRNPFGLTDGKLEDILSSIGREMNINEQVIESAKKSVGGRNFETRHFYVVPGDEQTSQLPWVFAGDGVPPNGAETLGAGNRFPLQCEEGDYYLRTDYSPHNLFRRVGTRWVSQEIDYREGTWSVASRTLKDFINNTKKHTHADGIERDEKIEIHKAAVVRADL